MKKATILTLTIGFFGFVQCRQPDTNSGAKQQALQNEYMAKGKSIVDTTFKTLGGHLQSAMAEGGIPNAIDYCKLNAMPLTAELSESHNASISRKAVRYRNPANEAKGRDADIFAEYANKLEEGIELSPQVMMGEELATYYHPIIMAEFCTNCHGSKEKIGDNYTFISEAYPNDKAIGFEAGDLRGLWKVEFKR